MKTRKDKTETKEKKQLRTLSEEELEQVTGGGTPSDLNCKDKEYRREHPVECIKIDIIGGTLKSS